MNGVGEGGGSVARKDICLNCIEQGSGYQTEMLLDTLQVSNEVGHSRSFQDIETLDASSFATTRAASEARKSGSSKNIWKDLKSGRPNIPPLSIPTIDRL